MPFQRTKTCKRCGLCCGRKHPDTGLEENPWPAKFSSHHRHREWDDLVRRWGYIRFVGDRPRNMDDSKTDSFAGKKEMSSGPYKGVSIAWEFDPGWHKPGILECPFLMEDPGDGTRPCCLVGSDYESDWINICKKAPLQQFTEEQYKAWVEFYGRDGVGPDGGIGCSYGWEKA